MIYTPISPKNPPKIEFFKSSVVYSNIQIFIPKIRQNQYIYTSNKDILKKYSKQFFDVCHLFVGFFFFFLDMRDMGDINLNSNDAVLFGTISHFFIQKLKGLQFEIRATTNKFDFWV